MTKIKYNSKAFFRKLRMSGLLLVFLLLILLPGTYAQKVHFADKNNNWLVMHTNYVDGTNTSQVPYAYLDTNIQVNGMFYKGLVLDRESNGYPMQLLVREDTVAGKIYFKSWDQPGDMVGNGAYLQDTAEFVAYNFGLNVGDTMIMPFVYWGYGTSISMHILIQKDSVKINDVWHIAQRFKCPLGFGSSWSEYDVIEGVGSLTGPVNPAPFLNFENTHNLYCFSNGDTLSPSSITLPFSPSQGSNSFRTVSFSTCKKLDISERTLPEIAWTLSPNPTTGAVVVELKPVVAAQGVYHLMIQDPVGKVLYSGAIKMQLRIPVSTWAPGLYFVTLSDHKGRKDTRRLVVQ